MTLLLALLLSASASTDEVVSLLRQGQDAAALSASRQAVVATPGDVEAHELLIDLLVHLGLAYQAENAYRSFKKDNDTAMGWYLFGRSALQAEDAREAYTLSLAKDETYARGWMGLASIDRAQGGLSRSEERYRKALELDPGLSEAWAGLAGLLMQQKRYDEALEVTRRATEAVPKDPEGWLAGAALDEDNARSWLEEGVKNIPDEPRLLHAVATARIHDNELALAQQALAKAVEIDPGLQQARADLAVLKEIEAKRFDLAGHGMLARARQLSSEAPVAALDTFDLLVKSYPDCYLVWLGRGHLYAEQDLSVEAEADLKKALALSPKSSDVQGALGMMLLNEGSAKEALPLLAGASVARPEDVQLGVSVGLAKANVEGVNAGVTHLAQVAERHPNDTAPVMALVSVLVQAGRPDAAYTVLDRALERYPHPTLLLAFAAAAKDLGKNDKAAETLRELAFITGDAHYDAMADELSPR
ncbi:MAG: tetratricopeptide repeat protein [Proteobacteria bacterium]|nr:tetratricopeptide repeat protein [Pseudomonadota bacterium]MCP4917585.1 tetratricopeptide repeat protein [Pseudomonadota bacterium]